MTAIGLLYAEGHGVPKDMNEARQWYEKAANQKAPDSHAMLRLGMMYRDGDGVAQDDAKAHEWLEKSSDNGGSGASFFLARDYIDGTHGVQRNEEKAFLYMERAFNGGSFIAALPLATMYTHGQGVKADPVKGEEIQKRFDDEPYWEQIRLKREIEFLQD